MKLTTLDNASDSVEQYARLRQELETAHFARFGRPAPTVGYEINRKYARVFRTYAHGGRDVLAFVCLETGTIFKADSWKRPSKTVLGFAPGTFSPLVVAGA